jgi:hypothetical protein
MRASLCNKRTRRRRRRRQSRHRQPIKRRTCARRKKVTRKRKTKSCRRKKCKRKTNKSTRARRVVTRSLARKIRYQEAIRKHRQDTKKMYNNFVRGYYAAPKATKIAVLENLTPLRLKLLVSLFKNMRKRKVELAPHIRKRIGMPRYKSRIRELLGALRNDDVARHLTSQVRTQKGGFWPILLSTALPIAAQILYDQLK